MKDDLKPLLMEVMGDDALKGNHFIKYNCCSSIARGLFSG